MVFDTNSNGIPDSAIVGKITFSEDPTDGLDPGAVLNITFTIQNTPVVAGGAVENGTVTGSGDLTATLGALTTQADITGTITLTDTANGGCLVDLTFPLATPLHLDFGGLATQLAANVVLFEFYGTVQMILETLGHTLDATITILNGDQTISVVGDIDGIDSDFDFELLPSTEILSSLAGCTDFGFQFIFSMAETIEDVVAAAGGGTPPAGVVVTPTLDPDVFTYAIDLAILAPSTFTAGMVTGQATFSFPAPVQLAGIVSPNEVAVTWTIVGATLTTGEVVTGQYATGRPLRLSLDLGTVLAFEGAGSITITPASPPIAGVTLAVPCVFTFDIPATDPIQADESDGSALITTTLGDDVMVIYLDFFNEEAVITANGVPLPFLFL